MHNVQIIHCSHPRELFIALIEFYNNKNSKLIIRKSKYISDDIILRLKNTLATEDRKRLYFVNSEGKLNYLVHKIHEILLSFYFRWVCNVSNVILFSDGICLYKIFKNRSNIDLFEHGLVNYQQCENMNLKKMNFLKKIKNIFFLETEETFGRYDGVSHIYLLSPDKAPHDIKNKVLELNLGKKWKLLTDGETQNILNVFDVKDDDIEKFSRCNCILFTQPVSEHGFVSEQKKVAIYRKVIDSYSDYKVIIKKHPRETTNYQDYFDCEVISSSAPFEIYELLGVRFAKAVTLYSSIVYSLSSDTDVDFLGVEYDDELKRNRGLFVL